MSTAVRVGVIGAGTVGADHVHTLHHWVSGAEVVGVADVDGEGAAAVAAATGARASGDGYALIADLRVRHSALTAGLPHHRGEPARTPRHLDRRPRFTDARRLQRQAWTDAVARGEPSPPATHP